MKGKQEHVDLVINNFEIEFDCSSDKERKTLEGKLKLITLGNEQDLCIITCDDKGCKAAKLKIRGYDNIDKAYYKNGAIEIEITDSNPSVLANNCLGVYYVPERRFMHIGYKDRGLLVRIIHK